MYVKMTWYVLLYHCSILLFSTDLAETNTSKKVYSRHHDLVVNRFRISALQFTRIWSVCRKHNQGLSVFMIDHSDGCFYWSRNCLLFWSIWCVWLFSFCSVFRFWVVFCRSLSVISSFQSCVIISYICNQDMMAWKYFRPTFHQIKCWPTF